jgi:hypothetical protein
MKSQLKLTHSVVTTVFVGAVALGCGSETRANPAPDAGSDAGVVNVTVAPTPAKVLTCTSATFTATVSGISDTSVTWAVTPSGAGAIDGAGKYTAPIATPTPATATVTATSHADATKSGTASVSLATAFPGAAAPFVGSPDTVNIGPTMGVYPHMFAAKGTRAYGVWPSNPGGVNVSLQVTRSDDGGKTWQAPVAALSAVLSVANTGTMACPAVTIDPVNPDVVYVLGHVTGKSSLATGVGANDMAVALAVSKDGGKTWTTRVLHVGGGDVCPDLVAPAKDTIVIESPHLQNCDGTPDLLVWSDTANGDGFANKGPAAAWQRVDEYVAAGYTDALDNVSGKACGQGRVDIGQNGTTGNGGEVTEAPRLFTNGAGRTCIAYVGTVNLDGNPHPPPQTGSYIQCSDDAGKTFSTPVIVDPQSPANIDHSSTIGAFGPSGSVAMLWAASPDGTNQTAVPFVALSADGGKTFGAPARVPAVALVNPTIAFDAAGILWLAYRANDGGPGDRVLVDKSCDGGKTWSGAVLVNGTDSGIANLKWPVFVMGDGAAPRVVGSGASSLVSFPLAP